MASVVAGGGASVAAAARAWTTEELALGYRLDRVLVRPAVLPTSSARAAATIPVPGNSPSAAATPGVSPLQLQAARAALCTRLGLRSAPSPRRPAGAGVVSAASSAGATEVLLLPADRRPADIVRTLQASGLYAYAEPDYLVRAAALPDDPAFAAGTLWALENSGVTTGVPDADIDAPEAWDICSSAPGTIVAVVDSGLRLSHEDLWPNLWTNPGEIPSNGLDDDGNGIIDDLHGIDATAPADSPTRGDPTDTLGHGSHVAGIIGAAGNNYVGSTGVAWGVQLMPLRFLDHTGSGSVSDAVACLDYARLHGARVINASWGTYGLSEALREAVQRCRDAGILIVAAAGNDTTDVDTAPYYPAAYAFDRLVAVAATDQKDALATFPNGSASNFGHATVHLAAPGRDIYAPSHDSDDGYSIRSGTSMAAAHVTGALALLTALYPDESPDQWLNRLLRGVDLRPALVDTTLTGGRLNLHGALTTPLATPPPDDFADATVLTGSRVWHRATTHAATAEPGEPDHTGSPAAASVWFVWTAPLTATCTLDLAGSSFDTRLAVYQGTSLGALTLVTDNHDTSAFVLTSRVTFSATAGMTYRFAVDGQAGATGLVKLQLDHSVANDAFAGAIALPATLPAQLTTSSRAATAETLEPAHAGAAPAASLWFRWTAPTTGRVAVATLGSSFETRLAVYTGSSLPTVGLVGENQHAGPDQRWSRVEWQATAGTTYRIAVDGDHGATGTVVLTLARPPTNNAFASAAPLAGFTTGTSDLRGASREGGEPAHAGDPSGASVWWRWTATTAGPVRFHTTGSAIDTVLAVYTGGPGLSDLTLLGANDDDPYEPASLHSAVTLTVAAGQTYGLAVAGFHGAQGRVRLTAEPAPENAPPVVDSAAVQPEGEAFSDTPIELVDLVITDPEGDGYNTFLQWQFSANGTDWTDAPGETTGTLTSDPARAGLFWRLRIVAADLRGDSEPFFTPPIAFDHRPPSTARHGLAFFYDCDLPLATGALGASSPTPKFRVAAGTSLPPGLTLNTTTGVLSGTPNVPAGGLYDFVIERYTGNLVAARPLSLLIGTAAGAYRVPVGRTWTLTGDTELTGALALDGAVERGSYQLTLMPVFTAWTALHLAGRPVAERARSADPEADGYTNLAEWAFGGRPLTREPAPRLPIVELLTFFDGDHLVLTFQRQAAPRALDYVFEASTDLVTWTELSIDENLIADIIEGDEPFYEIVVVRDPEEAGTRRSRYLRVRAVEP